MVLPDVFRIVQSTCGYDFHDGHFGNRTVLDQLSFLRSPAVGASSGYLPVQHYHKQITLYRAENVVFATYTHYPPGLAHSSGRGLFMGKVRTPGGGTKGYVPEEHLLCPPSLVLGRQCLFVECSASAYMDLAFWVRVLLRPWCMERFCSSCEGTVIWNFWSRFICHGRVCLLWPVVC